MDASTKECPECGYDYMEFYEGSGCIRYICPDCGYEMVADKNEKKEEK
jgi:transposase